MKKNCKKGKEKVVKDTLGYVVNKNVFIATPPIAPTFWLPSKEEVDSLSVGDHVKVIFVDKKNGERMWVQLTKQLVSTPVEWVGLLDNQPVFLNAQAGDIVRFSPLAIINYHKKDTPWEE